MRLLGNKWERQLDLQWVRLLGKKWERQLDLQWVKEDHRVVTRVSEQDEEGSFSAACGMACPFCLYSIFLAYVE